MKVLLFGFLLVVSQSLIFCQDADKFKTLFSKIESLETTVQILQKRDETQQTRIKNLEDLVRFQQEVIDDVITRQREEKIRLESGDDIKDSENNENTNTPEPLLAGDQKSNISKISRLNFGEQVQVIKQGKSMMRQAPEAVAFHATIAVQTHVGHLVKGKVVVFDSVYLNIGGGYHSSAGLFIAPKAGIYLFSLSVMLNKPATWISLDMIKNGAILAEAYAYDYDQGSVSVATDLQIGDEVIVKVHDSNVGMVYGEKLTSFTGILIMPF